MAKRLAALLVFSGVAPTAVLAQVAGDCESMEKVNARASATAKLSQYDGATIFTPSFDAITAPKAMKLSGATFAIPEDRPWIKAEHGSYVGGTSLQSLTVHLPRLAVNGTVADYGLPMSFAYNGKIKDALGATIFSPDMESLGELETDVVVTITPSGFPPLKPIKLTFSKADIKAAAQSGVNQLTILEGKANRRECSPISLGAALTPGCFLTSAACDTIGLADDCWELRTLRRFRDDWLVRQDGGAQDIASYYAHAPAIAARLRDDPRALVSLYWTGIVPSALAARLGMKNTARRIYQRMMRDLMAA